MAKQLLQVSKLASSGLNSDLIPFDLPADFVTALSNVRIKNEQISAFGGYADLIDFAAAFEPGYMLYVRGEAAGDNGFWLIAGNNAVYAYDGSALHDITSAVGYALDEDLWNGCKLGDVPVLNHQDHVPEYWSPQTAGTILKPLPWDPGTPGDETWADVDESCRIMRSHKQFLFAMDLTSGVWGSVPDGVRWSNPADIGSVPDNWNHLDDTNVAGLTNMGGNGGRIIDGLSLRDAFVVYQETGVTIFDYVPRSPYVWRIREQSTTFGLVSINAVVEVKGRHFFISDGDILMNDGNSITSIMHNRIRQQFIIDINGDAFETAFAFKNTIQSEIWFCIPGAGADHPTLAYIYNWRDGTWAIRDIPETPSAGYGSKGSIVLTGTTWDTIAGSWASQTIIWNASNLSVLDDSVLCVVKPNSGDNSEATGKIRLLDLDASETDFLYETVIERVGFAIEGLKGVTTITSIYPHMTGSEQILIELGSQEFQNGPVTWKPGALFFPDKDRKVDIRTTGALHSYRFSSTTASAWSISGFDIEYISAGAR